MSKKKRLFVIILLIVILAAAATLVFMNNRKKTADTTGRGREKQAIPVQAVLVDSGDLNSVNTLTGMIAANLQTTVGSKIAGKVQAVYADMGQAVHTGQVLAQLDPSDLQAQLAQIQAQIQIDEAQIPIARNNAEQAKADNQRYEVLYSGNTISKQQLEQNRLTMENDAAQLQVSQATLNKDQAAAATIKQQLEELTIASPIDGVVAAKNVEVGMQVSTQTAMFNLVQIDPIKVTVNVSDQIIADVHPGTTAQINVQQLGDKVFQGEVGRVSPVLDQASHAYPVEIKINNPNQMMQPGMTASVQLTGLKIQPGIIIPAQAILETAQGSEVFTVENNVAKLHIIQLGAVSSDKAVVTGGLQAGAQLVINGQSLLSDGTPVNVVQNANQAGAKGMINQPKGAGK